MSIFQMKGRVSVNTTTTATPTVVAFTDRVDDYGRPPAVKFFTARPHQLALHACDFPARGSVMACLFDC